MKKRKVTLLFPLFYEGFVMRKVPLGLAYLASSLTQRGVAVEAFNLNVDPLESIDFSQSDFVGITCLTPFLPEIRRIAAVVIQQNPSIKIVIGGPHPTDAGVAVFKQLPFISYAVMGEGELAFAELVTNEAGRNCIPGVYYRDNDGVVRGTPPEIPDINNLPYPEQRLFDHGRLEKRNPFRAILASRGCPFRCRNCQPILSKVQRFRIRSVEDVIQEIVYLQRNYGQEYFGFLDSEFPLKKSWLIEFHREVKNRGIKFSFHCNGHASILDEEIIDVLKDLNICRLAIGIESGVQRVIDEVLLKKIDLEKVPHLFDKAKAAGIRAHGHMMIGIPGETLDDMRQTLAYARDLSAASLEFNMLTPWPGTAFYEICAQRGYLTEIDTDKFNEKRVSYVTTEDFTSQQVMDFYQEIRKGLTSVGWINSSDGSVYYHPDVGAY